MASGWTCQRQSLGKKCRHKNRPRSRVCVKCGKPRPKKRRPAHMKALDLPYEFYVELQGGEFCGICGTPPPPNRKLDRDHEHVGDGTPRGVLCRECNRKLRRVFTSDWLRAAADYLDRKRP